jgi:hypothetical protein
MDMLNEQLNTSRSSLMDYVPSDDDIDFGLDDENGEDDGGDCPMCAGLIQPDQRAKIVMAGNMLCSKCLAANQEILGELSTIHSPKRTEEKRKSKHSSKSRKASDKKNASTALSSSSSSKKKKKESSKVKSKQPDDEPGTEPNPGDPTLVQAPTKSSSKSKRSSRSRARSKSSDDDDQEYGPYDELGKDASSSTATGTTDTDTTSSTTATSSESKRRRSSHKSSKKKDKKDKVKLGSFAQLVKKRDELLGSGAFDSREHIAFSSLDLDRDI